MYEAGPLEVDLRRRELRAHGRPVPIGSRAFEIIAVLAQSAGQLVSKDSLMNRVWPGSVIEESTIQVHISAIRKALGQDRTILQTISGRGYRLLGDWTVQRHDESMVPIGLQPPQLTGEPPRPICHAVVSSLIPARGRAALQQVRDLLSAYRVIVTVTGTARSCRTRPWRGEAAAFCRLVLATARGWSTLPLCQIPILLPPLSRLVWASVCESRKPRRRQWRARLADATFFS